jgi:glutamyl-tRNA reductase
MLDPARRTIAGGACRAPAPGPTSARAGPITPPQEACHAVSVVVVGLEHKRVPLDVLERVAVTDAEMAGVLAGLRQRENISEVVVLSTCLRTEVYAVVDRFHDAVFELQEFFAKRAETALEDLESLCAVRFDDDVAMHLFTVAAGLESAVLGESEVLGQVRRAWERSDQEHASGPVLAGLFREAVRVGRRARAETAIARGSTSFAHAAVGLAATRLDGGLAGRDVTVVGAGDIGGGILGALTSLSGPNRPRRIVVANRTAARSRALVDSASSSDAVSAVDFDELPGALAVSDVVFSALDVNGPLLGRDHLAPAAERTERPVLVVDLGVPRNVEPVVAEIPGVTVLGMDELRDAVAQVSEERHAEIDAVLAIVEEELDRYRADVRGRGAAPVIAALRAKLESLRVAELERQRPLQRQMSEEEWAKIDEASQAALAKVLHHPTMLLKETAGTPRGERLVEALRVLFDL